jgi:predicted  nucleic acid-binding Zn ribbon protein
MHTLSIAYDQTVDESAVWHQFNLLLGNLRHNGQLIGREMHPHTLAGRMSATVFTVTEEALDERWHNDYVRTSIAGLEQICNNLLKISYVGRSEDEVVCDCQTHPYYVLTGFYQFSPLFCGGCSREIPLFRFPKLHDLGYWTLTGWDNNYRACITLDLNCTVGERWAIRQQCDPASALSRQGRAVATRIAELTNTPVYYYLPNFIKRPKAKDRARPCPGCGAAWQLPTAIHGYVRHRCDTCLLMSSRNDRS